MMLRAWREQAGLSQEEVAIAIGLRSKGQISGFEKLTLRPTTDLAIAIDRLTAGKVTVRELRPDLHDVRVLQTPEAGAAA